MGETRRYKIIVSERAKRMLETHIRFVAQVNKDAACKTKRNLIAAIRSLETMPKRYGFFEEVYIPQNKYHKMFVQEWYLVLYQVQDDVVLVEYIIDCRTEYSWLLK